VRDQFSEERSSCYVNMLRDAFFSAGNYWRLSRLFICGGFETRTFAIVLIIVNATPMNLAFDSRDACL